MVVRPEDFESWPVRVPKCMEPVDRRRRVTTGARGLPASSHGSHTVPRDGCRRNNVPRDGVHAACGEGHALACWGGSRQGRALGWGPPPGPRVPGPLLHVKCAPWTGGSVVGEVGECCGTVNREHFGDPDTRPPAHRAVVRTSGRGSPPGRPVDSCEDVRRATPRCPVGPPALVYPPHGP